MEICVKFTEPWYNNKSNINYYLVNEEEYKLLQRYKKEREYKIRTEIQKVFFKLKNNEINKTKI